MVDDVVGAPFSVVALEQHLGEMHNIHDCTVLHKLYQSYYMI